MNESKLHKTIKLVTDLLAQMKYGDLAILSKGTRLSAGEIQILVTEYGRKIVPLPPEGFARLDIVAINGTDPQRWSLHVPIFTVEEGQSDLTLQLTLIDSSNEHYAIAIDDLHVL